MMLFLLLSVFVSQVFLVSPLAIGDKRMQNNKDLSYFEDNKAEVPSFLLTFYNQIMAENEAHGEGYLLEIVREKWHQETGEFYFLPSLVRTPAKTVQKAELFLSTHELAGNEKITVSIYEARTGIKVSSRDLSSNRSDWLRLPVTKMAKKWIAQEDAPLRFKVFVNAKGSNETAITGDIKAPKFWLVVYSEAHHEQTFPAYSAPDVKIRGSSGGRPKRDITHPKMAENKTACRKEDMIVESGELIKSAKIIFPRSFNAYQCSGTCSGETEKTKFINHSILKSYVLQKRGIKSNDKPCCVASKLKQIAFIHSTDDGGFALNTIKDLIVEKCGCY